MYHEEITMSTEIDLLPQVIQHLMLVMKKLETKYIKN